MAKRPASIQVDTIVYKQAGMSATLYLDKKTLVFHATFMDETFRGVSADDVKTQVFQAMKNAASMEWNPVIEVEKLAPFGARYDSWQPHPWVGFSLDRFYVAKRYNGTYAKVEWVLSEHVLEAHGDLDGMGMQSRATSFYWPMNEEFCPPIRLCRPGDDRPKHYLPYTVQLWEGLQHLQQAISALGNRLDAMLESPEGLIMLTNVGQRLMALALPDHAMGEENL
jgi:hypothetical protein